MLIDGGFREVYSLDGGIRAWGGHLATGVPDAGMSYFSGAVTPQQMVALAWRLEEGSRKFYARISLAIQVETAKLAFEQLESAEEHHKATLLREYSSLTGADPRHDFAERELEGTGTEDIMEGGMKISEALTWIEGRALNELLELVLSLETNAYDLYIKMERSARPESSRKIFRSLAQEERIHLDRVAELLDEVLGAGKR